MNFVDIFILLVLAVCVLGGYYKGFISTLVRIGATILSFFLALALSPLVSGAVRGQQDLYATLLYYTEGSEYVALTDVELTRTGVAQVTSEQLRIVLRNANMPIPMDAAVQRNIAVEAFREEGIGTLGDYFNRTIVAVTLNICSIVLLFALIRALTGLVIGGIEYARGFPMLRQGDSLLGAALGVLHGALLLFVIFMLLPVALVVLPRVYTFISESYFGTFFYRANPFLRLVPYV